MNKENSYTGSDSAYEHFAFLHEGCHIYQALISFYEYYSAFIPNLGNQLSPKSLKSAFNKGYDAVQFNYNEHFVWGVVEDGRSTPQINNQELAEWTYL